MMMMMKDDELVVEGMPRDDGGLPRAPTPIRTIQHKAKRIMANIIAYRRDDEGILYKYNSFYYNEKNI